MAPTKPTLSRLSELTSNQQADFFALLADKTRDVTREGKPYYRCRFRDARRSTTFMAWADDEQWFAACERDWQAGHFYKLRATYEEHERYGPQIKKLRNIRPVTDADRADGFDEAQFVERSRQDVSAMLGELRTLAAKHVSDGPLRALVLGLLERHAEALSRLPAARDGAYPFVGGLLEHTLAVTRVAVDLAERYAGYYTELKPPLNRDLVAAAAVLHDLGRVREYGDEATAPSLTVPGRLVGPVLLGRDLVRDAAREQGDVAPELLQLLEHVLLTCHGPADAGGPRLPLVPEALIVHYADEMDLKLEMFVRCLTRDQAGGPFTDRDPALGRALLKGRGV
jgi:3'-5' exoribonuclease